MALDANNIYRRQVRLLVRVLPLVDTEKCFALKGETAINLFYRAMSELLAPNRKDISEIYETEFKQMAEVDVPLDQLEYARENLIYQINSQMTDNEKKFLLSFKNKTPDWNLLEMENVVVIANLPSVLWKMINLEKMPAHKHKEAYDKLQNILFPAHQ
jgi:hypothetical protein